MFEATVYFEVVLIIGDVRSLESVKGAMHGVDYIFHAAALKQVPSCEFFPMEAARTNVIGTDNVLTAAIEADVESVICLSTDKAAYPINAMGITKAIEEKVAVQSVDTAVELNKAGEYGIPVPDYVEENVSTKVVKIIQSYTGVVNKMVWRKDN